MTSARAPVSTVANWLAELGLDGYADGFARADIDLEVLPHLTDTDLKELGVSSLGHRRKILARLSQISAGQATAPATAELRYLTVMFCDLVGSTRLSEKLGPERFTDLLNGFYEAVEQSTDPFGGHVAQYHGDGVLVYFGYPNVIEDAALRGVLSACKVVATVADLPPPHGNRLAVRVGVASGLVVVDGQRIGRSAGTGGAFGATVNLAARVQGEAEPGTAVLAESTASLVQDHFDLRPLGQRRLKGVEAPCPLFEVRAQRAGDMGTMQSRPGRARFVGREAEFHQLASQWSRARDGDSRAIAVVGEPGIGKTRLISEFLSPIRAEGYRVKRIVCQPRGRDVPFHAFRNALQRDRTSTEETIAALMQALDNATGGSQIERRQRRAQLIASLVDHFAGDDTDPRVLWLEDLHWADPSTVETLATLIAARRPGLLVVAGTRDPSPLDRLGGDGAVSTIALSPLNAEDTGHIIEDILSGISGGERFFATLAARAEGMPIFAEELARETRTRLAAAADDDPGLEPAQLISSSLQQSLQARIGQLTVARPLMRLVASIGRDVPVPLLRDLWPGPSLIEQALNELVGAGLAQLKLAHREDQENRLIIRHQLIVDCAYDMILMRDRTRIHSDIADALDRRAEEGISVEPSLRADQLERADRLREAAELWAAAGRRAALQSADAEAVSLYRRALALIPRFGESDSEWSEQFEADTHLAMFPALIGAYGYCAAGSDIMPRIQKLTGRIGGTQRVFSSLFLRWLDLVVQGDIDTAHEFAIGLAGITAADDSGLQQLMFHRMIGSTHMFRGEFAEARHHLHAFLDAYQPDRHGESLRQFGATDNFVTVLSCLAAIEAIAGTESAPQAIDRAVAAAEKSGHTHTLCHTLTFGASLPAAIHGDWDAVSRYAGQLADITTDRSLQFWMLFANVLKGTLEAARGDFEAGHTAFTQSLEALQSQGFRFLGPTFRVVFALAAKEAGTAPAIDLAKVEEDLAAGERWLVNTCKALRGTGS